MPTSKAMMLPSLLAATLNKKFMNETCTKELSSAIQA